MRAIIAVISVGFLLGTLAEDCVINVSESLVKSLANSTQSVDHCIEEWNTVVNILYDTREKLIACNEHTLRVSDTEPSAVECQEQLENIKREMQTDHNDYANTMKQQIEQNQKEAKKYEQDKTTLKQETELLGRNLRQYYRDLIFLNIAAGSSKQAIKYFHRYLEGKPPDNLLTDLVNSMYNDPAYEKERLENLLDFARKLGSSSLKLSLYHLIFPAMLNHPKQRNSYQAMILALDVGPIAFATQDNVEGRRLYLAVFQPALAYLKRKVETEQYDEIVTFATKYPNHFEEIENRLSTLDTDKWRRINFNWFVKYPNRLPLGRQRLEAFRMLLLQINQRNKHDFKNHLVQVAKELEQCEIFVTNGKNEPTDLEKLRTVKNLFAKLDHNQDYEYYLKEAKKQ